MRCLGRQQLEAANLFRRVVFDRGDFVVLDDDLHDAAAFLMGKFAVAFVGEGDGGGSKIDGSHADRDALRGGDGVIDDGDVGEALHAVEIVRHQFETAVVVEIVIALVGAARGLEGAVGIADAGNDVIHRIVDTEGKSVRFKTELAVVRADLRGVDKDNVRTGGEAAFGSAA